MSIKGIMITRLYYDQSMWIRLAHRLYSDFQYFLLKAIWRDDPLLCFENLPSSSAHLCGRICEADISLASVLGDCRLHCSVLIRAPWNVPLNHKIVADSLSKQDVFFTILIEQTWLLPNCHLLRSDILSWRLTSWIVLSWGRKKQVEQNQVPACTKVARWPWGLTFPHYQHHQYYWTTHYEDFHLKM